MQAEAAQRQASEKAAEAEAATRSLAATELTLADLREERHQALALRDERIRELITQVAELGRAGDSRSAEHQAALGTWMNAYNALRGAADKQRGELLALQVSAAFGCTGCGQSAKGRGTWKAAGASGRSWGRT